MSYKGSHYNPSIIILITTVRDLFDNGVNSKVLYYQNKNKKFLSLYLHHVQSALKKKDGKVK